MSCRSCGCACWATVKLWIEPMKEWYSLLACYPRTGRTHQIRAHLQFRGRTAVWFIRWRMEPMLKDRAFFPVISCWTIGRMCTRSMKFWNVKGSALYRSTKCVWASLLFCMYCCAVHVLQLEVTCNCARPPFGERCQLQPPRASKASLCISAELGDTDENAWKCCPWTTCQIAEFHGKIISSNSTPLLVRLAWLINRATLKTLKWPAAEEWCPRLWLHCEEMSLLDVEGRRQHFRCESQPSTSTISPDRQLIEDEPKYCTRLIDVITYSNRRHTMISLTCFGRRRFQSIGSFAWNLVLLQFNAIINICQVFLKYINTSKTLYIYIYIQIDRYDPRFCSKARPIVLAACSCKGPIAIGFAECLGETRGKALAAEGGWCV